MLDADLCGSARPDCIDSVLHELTSTLAPLEAACDHKAAFALTYLLETDAIRTAVDTPGVFADSSFLKQFDALFASYYFSAFNGYRDGHSEFVPPAWKIAFDAADARQLTAFGDALLGVSAHINRDLPFVLEQLGRAGLNLDSHRSDFDAVNATIDRTADRTLTEVSARLDPAFGLGPDGRPADPSVRSAVVAGWRAEAFRNAQRLLDAPTPQARSQVAAQIEDSAATMARSLQLAGTYRIGQTSADRDAFCASHHH